MPGTKRVYGPRSSSTQPNKKQVVSVRRQLMKLKETKRAVATQLAATPGANGAFTQCITDWNAIDDGLQSDQGLLTGMSVRMEAHSTASSSQLFRVLVLRSKRNDTITSGYPLFLDAAVDNGRPGSSNDVLAFEQMIYPLNLDGYVVKYDKTFNLTTQDDGSAGVADNSVVYDRQFIRCNETIQIYDDLNNHSCNYFIVTYGVNVFGTASTAVINTSVEFLFKDKV